jgi:hypothetical protein
MMEKLGAPQTHLGLKAMITEVDEDGDNKISFREVRQTSSSSLYSFQIFGIVHVNRDSSVCEGYELNDTESIPGNEWGFLVSLQGSDAVWSAPNPLFNKIWWECKVDH